MCQADSTEDLFHRARSGERQAFGGLAGRFRPWLASEIRSRMGPRVRGRAEPEDILQETFLKAWEHIAGLEWRGEEAFRRWLVAIAERLIWNLSRRPLHAALELEDEPPDPGLSPGRALGREERLGRLERALQGLSPDHRQVILLARIDRLGVAEIARRMGRSENAVRKLLGRALLELRRRFGDTTGSLRLPDGSLGAFREPLDVGGAGHGD